MKKIIFLILLLSLLLNSCNIDNSETQRNSIRDPSSSQIPGESSDTPNESSSVPLESSVDEPGESSQTPPESGVLIQPTQPKYDEWDMECVLYDMFPINLYSYEWLMWNFLPTANEENSILQYQKVNRAEINGEKFVELIDYLTEIGSVSIPLLNGKPMPLSKKGGIYLLTSSRYDFPWLWYYYDSSVKEWSVIVRMTYIDQLTGLDFPENATASEVMKMIDSTDANIYNKNEFADTYSDIYEKQIQLADRTVTAMIFIDAKDFRDQIFIYYDGLLISLYGKVEDINDEFLASLSFS